MICIRRDANEKNNDFYNRFHALGTNNRSRSIALYNGTTIYRTDPILRCDIKTWPGSIRVAHFMRDVHMYRKGRRIRTMI